MRAATLALLIASATTSLALAQQPVSYWHHDSTEGDTLFAYPSGIAVDHQRGLVYVADLLDPKIYVLDGKTGRVLRSGGRKGDGPGEFQVPGWLALSPDGALLAVHDLRRGSVDLLTPDLRPLERRFLNVMNATGELLLRDTTVVLAGGRLRIGETLSSLAWADGNSVIRNGPLPPNGKNPADPNTMMAREGVAGGALALGRDGVLMAEMINGDVWLVGRDGMARIAKGPGGVPDIVEKFMRPVQVNGKPGWSPWISFPQAIFLEEEAHDTFLLGWTELDRRIFRFYLLRPGAEPILLRELHELIACLIRYDATSFIICDPAERGEYRIERREIRLPK